MKKEMEADDESFGSYSTCFEVRLKAALREMQLGQSFSCSSNTNSKKKNDDDVMNNNNETTTTEDKEDKEDNKEEEEEKKRITQTRKEIIEKHILRDARRENDEALEKKLLTATATTKTLALYKENATVADAFLMAAGKITSALIEAYEDFLDDSSSSQCALADFISDALLRGDDKGKDKSKKSSSSNSKINSTKSTTYKEIFNR